ncbi:MAG TPA: hypothetical protein VH814_17970 [Steroidobacteraceae bacterium]
MIVPTLYAAELNPACRNSFTIKSAWSNGVPLLSMIAPTAPFCRPCINTVSTLLRT